MMPDSVKLENLLGMLTIKLNDDNFIKWNFQFCSVLRGYDLFDHFTGESVCPPKFLVTPELGVTNEISTAYKAWVQTDMALLSLLIATLSDDAMEYVVGCSTLKEWAGKVSFRDGVLKDIIHVMGAAGEAKSKMEKLCVISYDEMKVKLMTTLTKYSFNTRYSKVMKVPICR
jgi:hypothetical protein